MVKGMSVERGITTYKNGRFSSVPDEIVVESPFTIYVNDIEFATMVCTPTHVDEMVIGFLASEGVIRFKKEISSLNIDKEKGFAYVHLTTSLHIDPSFYSRRFIGSCCGKSREFYFQNDVKTAKTATTKTVVTPEQCFYLMQKMQEDSVVFKETGGVHNAALCTPKDVLITRADIGRHNALDKIYGYCLFNHVPVRDKVLAFSGRISSEVLTKAAKIGVGIVLSKSAPTNLAIQLAEDLNITAVGFIRGTSFNIYSHAERIVPNQNEDSELIKQH